MSQVVWNEIDNSNNKHLVKIRTNVMKYQYLHESNKNNC